MNFQSLVQCGGSSSFMYMKICVEGMKGYMCCTHWVPWGVGNGGTSSWSKELWKYLQERTLAINLKLWMNFGYVESKAREKTFKSEGLRGQSRELSLGMPATSPPVPAGSCQEWDFQTLTMSATKWMSELSLNCIQTLFNSQNLSWAPPVCQELCQGTWRIQR